MLSQVTAVQVISNLQALQMGDELGYPWSGHLLRGLLHFFCGNHKANLDCAISGLLAGVSRCFHAMISLS